MDACSLRHSPCLPQLPFLSFTLGEGLNLINFLKLPNLVLIRGLPGSGKSTMAKALARVGYLHLEADQFFEKNGCYEFKPAELPKAHAECLRRATEALKQGVPCVVANTFARRWEAAPYFTLAQSMQVQVRVIEATGVWPNLHGVPIEAIERMKARWEAFEA